MQKMTLRLAALFCCRIIDNHGLLLLGTAQAQRGIIDPPADPVGVESVLNKVHIADVIDAGDGVLRRSALMVIGRSLIKVWAERISLHYPDRKVLFYLGGGDSVILRFHTRRVEHNDWLDLTDLSFIAQSRIEVYELSEGLLNRIH